MTSNDQTAILCEVYRCAKKEGMYLYVPKASGTKDVPDALKGQMGELTSVMTLVLTADKKLARVNVADVLESLNNQGFFLQMPPAPGSPDPFEAI